MFFGFRVERFRWPEGIGLDPELRIHRTQELTVGDNTPEFRVEPGPRIEAQGAPKANYNMLANASVVASDVADHVSLGAAQDCRDEACDPQKQLEASEADCER